MHIERTVSLMAMHYCAQPAGHFKTLDLTIIAVPVVLFIICIRTLLLEKRTRIISNETPVILIA